MATATFSPSGMRLLRRLWHDLNLFTQFTLASLLVIGMGMVVLGYWINSQIKEGVIQHTAATTTLYMESFVEPLVQGMEQGKNFDARTAKALDDLLNTGPLEGKLIALKIWHLDGSVAYSNFHELIGQKFPIDESLGAALKGNLSAELGETDAAENSAERKLGLSLYEVYSPLYESQTGKLIGVGEFYLKANELIQDLRYKTLLTWLIVGLLILTTVAILSAIMFDAKKTIDLQRATLNDKVRELTSLLNTNVTLNKQISVANRKAVELNDEFLSRIGSDLHDGPIQLLSYALLRLSDEADVPAPLQTARQAVQDSLKDLRVISSGLVLPHLAGLSLKQALVQAIASHEAITGTKVAQHLNLQGPEPDPSIKICAYRVVQECLNNAFKHADGKDQDVTADYTDQLLTVSVSNGGKTIASFESQLTGGHLGLVGLQNRVETFGGTLTLGTNGGEGTKIVARIPTNTGLANND